MAKRMKKARLYDAAGQPSPGFNSLVKNWLEGNQAVREHTNPAAFSGIRQAYMKAVNVAISAGLDRADAHRQALNELTDLLFGHDIALELAERLNPGLVNDSGFRTTLSQGVAKNIGENFVNIMVYALADILEDQDEILIDKGLPPALKAALSLKRSVPLKNGSMDITIPIEGDLAIFSRTDPLNAIVISAKTRLKEVFHIGTMWKLLFDVIDDEYCKQKWGLSAPEAADVNRGVKRDQVAA